MYSITISMDPQIVRLFGGTYLDWHGIMVVLALVCGLALTFYKDMPLVPGYWHYN